METNRAIKRAFPEIKPQPVEPRTRPGEVLENYEYKIKLRRAIVETETLKEPGTLLPVGSCSPGWKYNASKQTLHRMNCKRRICRECGWYWSWTWRSAIQAKVERDKALKIPPAKLALTLTMAEYPDFKVVYDCFRYFWQLMRNPDDGFPAVQYLCFPEENQEHTLIHFHLIIDKVDFIHHEWIRERWITAQRWAGVEKTAWILRIERIKKNVAAYFAKYITKTAGKKDEIPRRENWQGRYVRNSKFFFGELTDSSLPYKDRKAINRRTLVESVSLQKALEAGDDLDRMFYQVRKAHFSAPDFMQESDIQAAKLKNIVSAPWEPLLDKGRAGPAPPDTLLDGDWTNTTYTDKFEPNKKKPTITDLKNLDERLKEAGREKLKTDREARNNPTGR